MLLCLLYLEFDFTQTSAHHSMNLWILNAVLFWRPLVSKTPACSKQQWANELNAAFTGPLERLEVSFSLWVVLACVLRSSLRAVLSLHLALWFGVGASFFQDCWGSGSLGLGYPAPLGVGLGTWVVLAGALPGLRVCSLSLGVCGVRGPSLWVPLLRLWGGDVLVGLYLISVVTLDTGADFHCFSEKTETSGLLGFVVFAIGHDQSGASGLYGVCVPVIWASLIGVELFMQDKLPHYQVLHQCTV